MHVDSSRRVLVGVGVLQMVGGGRMGLEHLPALSVVQLHPVVLAILNLAGALESLSEQLAEIVVVWCVLETKVSDVAQVFVKLL